MMNSSSFLRHALIGVIAPIFIAMALAGCGHAPVSGPSQRSSVSAGEAVGIASWYGRPFHGKRTASGERFDMHALTAAHPQLRFGTHVQVRSLRTGRSVTVRINDRGPFVRNSNRIIDLSFEAARRLGIVQRGKERVELTVLR